MSSEFSDKLDIPSSSSGWKERINVESQRFVFYKTRVYGALQLVKEVNPAYASDFQTLESLRKEFYIGFSLNHPAIPRYYRFEGNLLYEEYIDGLTLGQMTANDDRRLHSPEFVESTVCQLLEALDYIHSHGVIHRDLKPENLMVTHRGNRLKIIDFGAAESSEFDTTPGYTAGTLAPEQKDLHADVQTEIYQAGLVVEKLCERLQDKRRWEPFIRKATHPQTSERFRSFREALEAIPIKRKKSAVGYGVVIACIAMLLVGAGWYVFSMPGSKSASPPTVENTSLAETTESSIEQEEVSDFTPEPVEVRGSETAEIVPGTTVTPSQSSLEKKVRDYVNDCLASHLDRFLNTPPPIGDNGFIEQEYDREFRQEYSKAFDEVMAYVATLGQSYPQQLDMIEETAMGTFERKGPKYMIQFYKKNEEALKKLNAMRAAEE